MSHVRRRREPSRYNYGGILLPTTMSGKMCAEAAFRGAFQGYGPPVGSHLLDGGR